MMRRIKIFLGILCGAATFSSAESLLLLPIAGDTARSEDMASVNQLYRDVVESQFKGTVLPKSNLTGPCGDRDCALQAASSAGADEVIYSTFNRLGSKWVFSSTIVKTDGSDALNQRLTALSIEDMEAVTKRMGDALLNHKDVEQAATVDNITEKEETREPERRKSLYSTGVALGYLWPTTKYAFTWRQQPDYNYLTGDSTPLPDKHYSQIFRLAWVNMWELRNDLLLDAELVWGAPDASVGADLNMDYLFNRGDFSPFLGGGLGIHYVHEDYNGSDSKRNSGPALNIQGGLMLFRTYDFHVMLRGQYQVILNSDLDNGVGLSAVVTYHKKDEVKKQESSGGFFSTVGKIYVYSLVAVLALALIGAAAGN